MNWLKPKKYGKKLQDLEGKKRAGLKKGSRKEKRIGEEKDSAD